MKQKLGSVITEVSSSAESTLTGFSNLPYFINHLGWTTSLTRSVEKCARSVTLWVHETSVSVHIHFYHAWYLLTYCGNSFATVFILVSYLEHQCLTLNILKWNHSLTLFCGNIVYFVIGSFRPCNLRVFLSSSSRAQQRVCCVPGSATSFPSISSEGLAAPLGPGPRPGRRPTCWVPLRLRRVSGGDPGGVGQTRLLVLRCRRSVFTQNCPFVPPTLPPAQD